MFLRLEVNINLINILSDTLDFLRVKLLWCEFPNNKKESDTALRSEFVPRYWQLCGCCAGVQLHKKAVTVYMMNIFSSLAREVLEGMFCTIGTALCPWRSWYEIEKFRIVLFRKISVLFL